MALVAKALLTLQAGFGLVGALGVVVLMGFDPAYAVVPVAHSIALLLLSSYVGRRRRWALTVTIVLEGFALAAWVGQVLVGLLPQVDFTVTLTGLLTMLILPVAVVLLSACSLGTGTQA